MHYIKKKQLRGTKSPYFALGGYPLEEGESAKNAASQHGEGVCNFEGRYAMRAEEYTGAVSCVGVIWKAPRHRARAFLLERKKWSIVPISAPSPGATEERFNALAEQWRNETGHFSILARRYLHPAYMGILAMGPRVVPIILRELAHRPDRWFSALSSLTGVDQSRGTTTFDEAVDAWLDWGRRQGFHYE